MTEIQNRSEKTDKLNVMFIQKDFIHAFFGPTKQFSPRPADETPELSDHNNSEVSTSRSTSSTHSQLQIDPSSGRRSLHLSGQLYNRRSAFSQGRPDIRPDEMIDSSSFYQPEQLSVKILHGRPRRSLSIAMKFVKVLEKSVPIFFVGILGKRIQEEGNTEMWCICSTVDFPWVLFSADARLRIFHF